MNYPLSYPYIKVYSDNKNRMRYVWHSSTTKRGMQKEDTVGNVLIESLLLDLTDHKKRINDVFHNDDFTIDSVDELTVIMLNAEIYEIAKMLLPLHEIACFYLFGKLNDETKEVPTTDKSAAQQTFLAWSESAKDFEGQIEEL